jgi:HlyD family secretion protein
MKVNFMASLPRSLRWVMAILALLILLGLTRFFVSSLGKEENVNPPLLVSVTEVAPGEIGSVVTFTGAIAARDEAALSAEGEGGRVSALYAEVGDSVRAGQLLAKLDTSLAAPQVVRLEATLEEAQANAAVAAADYRRAQAVAEIGALSAQEIERRQAAQVAAEATVKVAEAQLSEARARLARTEVRAPFDGIVLTRSAEVGQLAAPGSGPLFRLGRADGIEMRGNVAEQDLPQLAEGMQARVRVTGVDQIFEGRVRLIGAVIDPQTRLGSVRIDLPLHRDLRPGAFARGEVETTRETRALIPQTAVMTDDAGNYVYVVTAEERVQRRDIRVASSRPDGVVIHSGLDAGDRVVTLAGPYLREGETVRVAE